MKRIVALILFLSSPQIYAVNGEIPDEPPAELPPIETFGLSLVTPSVILYYVQVITPIFMGTDAYGYETSGSESIVALVPNNPANPIKNTSCASSEIKRRDHANRDIQMFSLRKRIALRNELVIVQYDSNERETWKLVDPYTTNPTGTLPPVTGSCK